MIVTSLPSACATVSSEQAIGVCLPVVEYAARFLAGAGEEVQALREGSAGVDMLNAHGAKGAGRVSP